MSKAQTDIRTTSYDELAARPFGYQGTIDDLLAQIRAEDDEQTQRPTARAELLSFLNVKGTTSNGPSVELDENPRYGFDADTGPSKYSLEYAKLHFPSSFSRSQAKVERDKGYAVAALPGVYDRLNALTDSQLEVYWAARLTRGVRASLAVAEAYPYPAVLS